MPFLVLLIAMITQASASSVTIPRSEILGCIGNGGACLKPAKAVPYKLNGKVIGWKLTQVKKSDFLTRLGLKESDIIISANGEDVTDSKKMPQWLLSLLSVQSIDVSLIRAGRPKMLEIQISD